MKNLFDKLLELDVYSSDKKLRDNMGIAGSHKVQVNFSLQSTTPALLKLIKGLIDV